ncbi:TIGR03751 family conjugal transfer lipoprotein [Aliikangiella maris]|uniref:TIGR03751 family conjugal transfer lipoprotein n=2 Tax=Aliikangiella maris TaxID=3162458 RepID=A0ABV2BYF5_9GAMM
MLSKMTSLPTMIILLLIVSGCATKMSDFADENGQTMKDIYDGTFNEQISNKDSTKHQNNQRIIREGVVDLRGYTRDSNNETNILFKRISNPILVGYVYPHLTKDGIPIPAYSIPFRMSPKDYFAMPGEEQGFE